MLCNEVSKRLSEYFDGVLDPEDSIRVLQHLKQCADCRKELDTLTVLHDKLASVGKLQTPDYVYHLVQTRLKSRENKSWYHSLKDTAALQWSRIRTTAFQFYWTRALGTVMAAFFFCIISYGIDPFYANGYASMSPERYTNSREYSEQVRSTISRNFGRFPIEQYKKKYQHEPAINLQYFDMYMDRVPETTSEQGLSVVATIEPSGTVKIENVLEQPEDKAFLQIFNNVFMSARGRPGSKNGKTVTSPLVLVFDWITVSSPED